MELRFKNHIESWSQTLGMWLFDLWVLTCRPPGPTSHRPRKIKIHNSIIWIQGRNYEMLREKLQRVQGSSHWNHGSNGELCPEYFQKGPRNFGFFFFLWEASASQLPRVLFFQDFRFVCYFSFIFLGHLCILKDKMLCPEDRRPLQWDCMGITMRFPLITPILHGISTEFHWNFHGLPLELLGIPM